jgi:hypothetical protein
VHANIDGLANGSAVTGTVNKSLLAPNVDPTTWLNQSYPSPNLAGSIYHSTELLTPLDNVWSGPSLDHPYVSSSAVNTAPIASQPLSFANGVGFGHPLFSDTSERTFGSYAQPRATDDVSVPTWARDLQDPFYNVIGTDFIDYAGADNDMDYIHRLDGFHGFSDLALQEATMGASHEATSVQTVQPNSFTPFLIATNSLDQPETGNVFINDQGAYAQALHSLPPIQVTSSQHMGLQGHSTQVVRPTQHATTASTAPSMQAPIPCSQMGCAITFKRDSDRIRHEGCVHSLSRRVHLCHVLGCSKSQGAGYTRRDKLVEHLWKKHANLGFVKRV